MNFIVLILKGAAIGIANAIPGVSGGTIAVITKIYDKLIDAISLNLKKLKENLPFLIPIGIGILVGIFLAAKVLGFLFEEYNVPTQLFFVGVIAGSIPILYKEAVSEKKLKLVNIIPFVIGIAIILGMELLNTGTVDSISTELTFASGAILLFSGFIAAVAMIIPGVSGSLMLKSLGAYDTVIEAVNELDFIVLAIFAVGVIAGLLVAAKVIGFLLKKHHENTYALIGGLILGSIPIIFPKEFAFDIQGIIGILFLILGAALSMSTEFISKKNK